MKNMLAILLLFLVIVNSLKHGDELDIQALIYADYVNLIGNDIKIINRNADVLLNVGKDIGLAVNTGKTKYMEVGFH